MNSVIPEQPMPRHLVEACELLSAAERYEGDLGNPADIRAGGAAGDALAVLLDVVPRYEPFREDREPQPLAELESRIRDVLARAGGDAASVEERLRIARAGHELNEFGS